MMEHGVEYVQLIAERLGDATTTGELLEDAIANAIDMLKSYAAILNGEIPYGWIACRDTKIFTDIPAAQVGDNGVLFRTLNGSPMLPGTKLYVAREKKA